VGVAGPERGLNAPNRTGNDKNLSKAKENEVFHDRQKEVKSGSREFCKWVTEFGKNFYQ
jgi:hypothetical protein